MTPEENPADDISEAEWLQGLSEAQATKAFDTECTDEPVCPHCGEVQGDAWEWAHKNGPHWCGSCDGRFRSVVHTIVSYTTTKEVA